MKNSIILGVVYCVCLGWVTAQDSDLDNLCDAINEKVVIRQNPVKVEKEEGVTSCTFKLDFANDKSVGFRVERYRKIEEASFELESIRLLRSRKDASEYPPKIRYKNNIDPDDFWDEAVYINDSSSESFILLRHNKFFILIVGTDLFVKNTESLFRKIQFD